MINSDWHEVGTLADIPRLGARVVNTPRGAVALFRLADDRVRAVLDRCPHKGGPLSQGIVHGDAVTCPLHNWVIDLNTGTAEAPDEGCVRRFETRLEGARLLLLLPADG